MELKTEIAEPVRLAHPAIVTAIGLLTQSAQDLADCVSIDGVPGWVDEPEAKLAYDKDIATATALMTVQAEIEAPLLARIEALGGSIKAAMAELDSLKLENAELRQGRDAIHLPPATSEMSRGEVLAALRGAGMENDVDYKKWMDANGHVVEITTASKPEIRLWSGNFGTDTAGEAYLELFKKMKAAQPAVIHLPADDTEGGDL